MSRSKYSTINDQLQIDVQVLAQNLHLNTMEIPDAQEAVNFNLFGQKILKAD